MHIVRAIVHSAAAIAECVGRRYTTASAAVHKRSLSCGPILKAQLPPCLVVSCQAASRKLCTENAPARNKRRVRLPDSLDSRCRTLTLGPLDAPGRFGES